MTPWVTSLNNGLNPSSTLSGNASLGLPSAFPSEVVPTGNSLGGLTDVGFGLNPVTDPVRSSPYGAAVDAVRRQYSFTNNDLLDITYVGNHGVHVLAQYLEWNELPAADLAMGKGLNADGA